MSLDLALEFTRILLSIALIQQSIEHLFSSFKNERLLFLFRLVLAILLIAGFATKWICLLLFVNTIFILKLFQGPYNGGSDRMYLLILSCLSLIHFMPSLYLQEIVFGYLALQLILSYFLPGFFKALNPEWWSGGALKDFFKHSGFPASEAIRSRADRPKFLVIASWLVILLELAFPLVLVNRLILVIGLVLALSFHLVNVYFFGFNRFVWAWLAAYPALIWLEQRLSIMLN